MNQKLSRLMEPNWKLYFAVLGLYALLAIPFQPWLAAAELAAAIGLYAWFVRSSRARQKKILQYIDNITGSVDTASKSTLINSPLPIMVFRPETGEVIWSNEDFLQLAGVREHLFEMKVEDAVPRFPTSWLLEGKNCCPDRVEMNGRRFQVYGSLQRAKGRSAQGLVATTYWVDVTESDSLREKYAATRPVLALIQVDNYDDLMKACQDTQRSAVLAQIDEKLGQWTEGVGVLTKTQRDHYLFLFEEKHFNRFAAEKFAVLDSIRTVKVAEGLNPTLSIGVGKDADTMAELYKGANLSLEMALSRGGDQAVVRTKQDFSFFGGRTKTTEKRTKVKSRVMANARGELMEDARQIYIMGHSYADMDALGAAAGLMCIARKRRRKAQIILDQDNNAAQLVLAQLRRLPEYAGAFVDRQEAFLKLQPGTLLIVVDTNRPEFVEAPQVLESCNRVAVIDHHRRAASYIENAALNFHEPYASSASELVTELLQYLCEPTEVLREEAEALLAGIVLDTKHFTLRTGGRTFEAAAFLRRSGADTTDVQRYFQNDLSDVVKRYDVLRRAEILPGGIAVAAIPEDGVDRVAAAQAADELLTLRGVKASFVLCRKGPGVILSGRSLGDVNVQVILEALGGGGNSTTAGGQVAEGDVADVRAKLLDVIEAYFEK